MVVLGGAFVKTFGRTATSIYPSSAASTHSIDCLDLQGKERGRDGAASGYYITICGSFAN